MTAPERRNMDWLAEIHSRLESIDEAIEGLRAEHADAVEWRRRASAALKLYADQTHAVRSISQGFSLIGQGLRMIAWRPILWAIAGFGAAYGLIRTGSWEGALILVKKILG